MKVEKHMISDSESKLREWIEFSGIKINGTINYDLLFVIIFNVIIITSYRLDYYIVLITKNTDKNSITKLLEKYDT